LPKVRYLFFYICLSVFIIATEYYHKSIGIGIGSTFQKQYWYSYKQHFAKVLLLVLTIVFAGIVNTPAPLTSFITRSQLYTSGYTHLFRISFPPYTLPHQQD